ncbi:MAG: hypothetical protein R3E96_14980 [Planctomycetota bacterium]
MSSGDQGSTTGTVAAASVTPVESRQEAVQNLAQDWSARLDQFAAEEKTGLSELWSQRPALRGFLSGLFQDSREARGLGQATYTPSAQLAGWLDSRPGQGIDLAI